MRSDAKPKGFATQIFWVVNFNTISETEALKQMTALQEKYAEKEAYSTSPLREMNDYLTELSFLSGRSTGSARKIIDSELYSSLTFYHLTQAVAGFSTIDFQNEKCGSQIINETRKQLKLAQDNSLLAEEKILLLNEQEKQNLRPNQLETIKNYQNTIEQLNEFFEENC